MDQGVQFTSEAFTTVLKGWVVVFVERPGERQYAVYLHAYTTRLAPRRADLLFSQRATAS